MSFPEYDQYDAVGLAGLIRSRQVSVHDVVAAAVERIERHNPALNAVVTKTYNRAMATAERGPADGPLAGVPYLLKDLDAHCRGVPCTRGSRSSQWFVPEANSTLVDRFEAAGLVMVGTTNTPELGLSPVTEPELHGPTSNPWDLSRSPGGSSGGAAAAVAAGMVPVAHASDGGGSIRIPASNCGLVGLKPTRGRNPLGPDVTELWGGFTASHVLTRSVRDCAAVLDAVHGREPGDAYAAPAPERPYVDEVARDPGRLRVGVVAGGLFHDDVTAEPRRAVRETADLLHGLGHTVEGVELPVDRAAWKRAFLTVVAASVAADVDRRSDGRPDPAMYELPTWILAQVGRKLGAVDYAAAIAEARRAGRLMAQVMAKFDVVVLATQASPPLRHGELAPTEGERRLLEGLRRAPAKPALLAAFRQLADKVLAPIPNTPLFNMTGQPAMSLPLHWTSDELPVGVQVVGRFGDEATLFRLAAQLEQAKPWFDRRPRG